MDNETITEVLGNLLKLSNSVLGSIIPEDAKRHFRSACKEALLGMIVMLDSSDEKHEQKSDNLHQAKQSIKHINISD